MKKQYIMDGNEACASAAYNFCEVCGVYPITPATPMGVLFDKWANLKQKNILGSVPLITEMQSEAGAIALAHGSLQAGSLSTTFTASQGLLLMIPSMYKIAGELLPCVIHVAARSLSTHALSIFGDHLDIYAVKSTGFAILSSTSVQDAYYMSLISHLSSIESSVPFVHFFDGFRTSHELNKINVLGNSEVENLVNYKKIDKFKERSLIVNNVTRGTSQTESIYFQNTESRNVYYDKLPDVVASVMKKVNKLAGTKYSPYVYYGSNTPRNVIIAMGSVTNTIKTVVDELNKINDIYGLITVHLFRPVSKEYFDKILPSTVQKIAVLDRAKEAGSNGETLYNDILSLLKGKNIKVVGGRYGLSGKNTTPSDIYSVFKNLEQYEPKNNFTVSINDDVTELSLPYYELELNPDYKEIKIFGFGSDGMVSASKNLLKLAGQNNYVQGYFEYDSKKSGGVTVSHLRLSNKKIEAPYLVTNPYLVVVSKDDYLTEFDILKNCKENASLIVNSSLSDEELANIMNDINKKNIVEKNIKVFVVNTDELNIKYNLNGKVNNLILKILLKVINLNCVNEFNELIDKTYSKKGKVVVVNNIKALNEIYDYTREFCYELKYKEEKNKKLNILDHLNKRDADELSVSAFTKNVDGTFESNMSTSVKSKISKNVVKWNKDTCLKCNQCSFVCPHAVIRPNLLTDEEIKEFNIDNKDTLKENDKNFYIGVSEENCTGCGLCINTCPTREKGTLSFGEFDQNLNDKNNKLFNEFETKVDLPKTNVKIVGFSKPKFEYPGACAGCGESGYIKLLTQLFGEELIIANATGCSSIYGASLPNLPYKIPWMSSLFEDNAEFGLGLYKSIQAKRSLIENIMYEERNNVEKEVKDTFKKWIDNKDDFIITSSVKNELKDKIIPKQIQDLIEYIPSKKVWIVGGDGWAYDIGYGGLDHVLHSNENVKILVLDTEVYSNTGGQASKSSKKSVIAEFSSIGKKTNKKDLFRICMGIENVYVANISLCNMNATIKAFNEADNHIGPSIIIAYSPCISHGITGGMRNSLEEEKLLVESGYNILMRYNPETNKLIIDSKEPDFSKYETVFKSELRYSNLPNINEKYYSNLYDASIDNAKTRYKFYKSIENKEL